MKKLFYIVLVIVALMVIGRFVKQGNQTVPAEIVAVEEITPEAVIVEEVAVDENGNTISEEEVITDDSVEAIEDIEEANPDETGEDGETVVKE